MLTLFIFIFIVVVATLLPVKLAAKLVGAKRTGFFACLLAVILAGLLSGIAQAFAVPGGMLSAWLISGIGFKLALDTTYLRALAISVLHVLITFVVGLLFVALFGVDFAPPGPPVDGVWL